MSQHFLASAKARTLSVVTVGSLTDEEAEQLFARIRWEETDGEPVCPTCGCRTCYTARRKSGALRYRCKECRQDFSLTSGTMFACHKLPIKTYLTAIVLFCNEVKGKSALALSRDLEVQYKTAWVLAHKLREAMASEKLPQQLGGPGKVVEVDGAYVGGYVKPRNLKANRVDRRKAAHRTGKRHSVVVVRERGRKGNLRVLRLLSEAMAAKELRDIIHPETLVLVDQSTEWNILRRNFNVQTINHSKRFSDGAISTNLAESFFSRLRRAERGVYHRISGFYLIHYAKELAYRERHRREDNGRQALDLIKLALTRPLSNWLRGYWQRSPFWELTKPPRRRRTSAEAFSRRARSEAPT